jgi:hypothetical protein
MQNNKEILHKEIDLIQSIISRLANNSFLIKGWVITIIVGVLALSNGTIIVSDVKFLPVVLLIPLISFWYLDAFFLHKERMYRKLYNWVINNRMYSDEHLYSLNYKRLQESGDGIFNAFFSLTLLCFYGLLFILLFWLIWINLF